MKKKLMIITGSMGRGGAERVISHISNSFIDRNWDVYIVLLLFNVVDYPLSKDIHVINLTGNTNSRIRRVPYWILNLYKLIKTVNPTSILSFAARINILTGIACLPHLKKVVMSERNDPFCDGRSKIIDIFTRFFYPKVHAVVFQTERAASYFKSYNLKNNHIISNPISVDCYRTERIIQQKIVNVGRLTEQKNQSMLIHAFSIIAQKYPDAKLYIYGEGELRGNLDSEIMEYGLSDKVFLKGNVLDLHKQIADSNLFILSSNYEGLSNALLEAMMIGLPCISTNCAGADEYIVDGINGVLVPVNDLNSMVDAIDGIFKDYNKAIMLGDNARNSVLFTQKDNIMDLWYETLSL